MAVSKILNRTRAKNIWIRQEEHNSEVAYYRFLYWTHIFFSLESVLLEEEGNIKVNLIHLRVEENGWAINSNLIIHRQPPDLVWRWSVNRDILWRRRKTSVSSNTLTQIPSLHVHSTYVTVYGIVCILYISSCCAVCITRDCALCLARVLGLVVIPSSLTLVPGGTVKLSHATFLGFRT